MDADDARFDVGLYSLVEAARLARLPRKTLRNWVAGYRYAVKGRSARAKPVIRSRRDPEPTLSFVNLVEAITLSGFRQAGVPMQRVRRALDYVTREMEIEHPLASKKMLTDGLDLFWEYQERKREEAHLVNISQGGQKVFPETVMRYLSEMEWGRDLFVVRWWPGSRAAKDGPIVVDPKRAFGAPVIAGTGIRTEDLFHRFRGGEPLHEVADDYGLTFEQVEAAIRIEAELLEPIAA